jgi:hypothetical protein
MVLKCFNITYSIFCVCVSELIINEKGKNHFLFLPFIVFLEISIVFLEISIVFLEILIVEVLSSNQQ